MIINKNIINREKSAPGGVRTRDFWLSSSECKEQGQELGSARSIALL